ncbi:hypothetical protein [Lysinibacillus xylanilyticus]|uniref:Uncharacterized protein n=1 Tax=Lysinibacillus xylanilyticus TaxID=582475 RepID=A0ABT4EWK1_9BACI|nr:hypothetical protein [Lysinibacillus xylanilyticus]MCY9549408.1 hypothetical protein [Lysinibacillus xylanilyticus]
MIKIRIKYELENNYIKYDFFEWSRVGFAEGKLEGTAFVMDQIFKLDKELKNFGAEALKLLEEHLKSLNVERITGECIPQDGMPLEKLIEFYKENGYKVDNGEIEKYL